MRERSYGSTATQGNRKLLACRPCLAVGSPQRAKVSSSQMDRGLRGRALRASVVGIALYVVCLLVTPFEHHDLVCHLKTPFHCTSCTSSLVGSDPCPPTVFDGSHLTDAGRASAPVLVAHGFLLPVRSPGRSPPSA